jgi:hypothetical protein
MDAETRLLLRFWSAAGAALDTIAAITLLKTKTYTLRADLERL